MADNDDKIKISELDPALTLDNTSETVVNKQVSGNWVTFKMTIATLAAHILEAFSSSALTTANKTVVGAINEIKGSGGFWTDITGTLEAGQTSLTLQNAAITESSTIDYFTDVFGVSPTNAVVTNGQIVLTFEALASDLGVKVRVS